MKEFKTKATELLPEIIWDETGAILGEDEHGLSAKFIFGIGANQINYTGIGFFVENNLVDIDSIIEIDEEFDYAGLEKVFFNSES